ncbi:MAG: thiamine pyrophosphate-binding protein [Acidobacteriota bacterium]
MKQAAKLLLERRLSRRAFVTRLTAMGLTSSVADGVAGSLFAAPGKAQGAAPSRVLEGLTGGELMAEFLIDWKVPYVFGLGGSEEIGFLDALVDRLSLQYVQALHEGSVMSMADGYARASGQTALMNLHSVAGAGYALAPMVNAFKDRIPVVITVGRQATALRGSNAFLEAENLHQLPRDYTRWRWDVMSAGTIPDVLRRAFLLARVPPGGPTFVTFSKDLWEQEVSRAEILPRSRSELDLDLEPNPDQVSRLADMLLDAELPVIVVGRELNRFGGTDELIAIAQLLGAPVFMDVASSHTPVVFPATHPLFLGAFAQEPGPVSGFDLFWSVGGTMFALGASVPEPLVPRSAGVVHTGLDAAQIGRNYPVDLAIMANVGTTAAAVLDELRGRRLPATHLEARRRTIGRYHEERWQRLQQEAERAWGQQPITTTRMAEELNRVLEPDAIVVSELVTSETVLRDYLDLGDGPSRRRNYTSSGGVLGWGVAAAVGAKIACPDRQVVALVGDGSFQFGVQALWSAVRYEVPIAILIWNNGGYQANRRFLHTYGRRAAATGKYIGASLTAPEIDNVALADGYGVEGERIEDPGGLSAALGRCLRALDDGRPYLLDVAIERRFGGADSDWYDFFSVARGEPRKS